MDEQTQEQENFDDTSLVKEAALVEAKKKNYRQWLTRQYSMAGQWVSVQRFNEMEFQLI